MKKIISINKISKLFKNKKFVTITIILILVPWILLSLQDETINNIIKNKYSVTNNKVSYTNVPDALNNFYSRLKFPDTYVYSTNKFLCTGTNITCIASDYTNIGLINKDEYNKIQGNLKGSKSYWTMTEESTNVYKITSNGIELEDSSNSVALRPSIYLQGDLRIAGSGEAIDPYLLREKNTPDIQILALYVNGVKTDTLPTTKYYELTSYVCNKAGVTVSWLRNTRQLTINGLASAPLQCSLYFDSYTSYADASGANSPMLASNMIPITWDDTDLRWEKADVMSAWYDYPTQKWANAVVVTEATRSTYLNAAAGTLITEADVLAYYVWMPRYAYTISAGYHLASTTPVISVKFLIGTTNITKDGTTIYMDNLTNSHYSLHPAFNFGGTQLTGVWVAKFETTGAINIACTNESCPTAPITSKPYLTTSVQSTVRSQTLGSFYYAIRSMERTENEYGFVSSEIDTHMIKNTEWGMVAYLAQSQYGKGSEVWINPSSSYYTGCAGASISASESSGCSNIYTSSNGIQASTTGNVTGIYDMRGGAYEWTMGNYNQNAGSSGLTMAAINSKYYDLYTSTSYVNTIYGDAVYETSSGSTSGAYSWYSDYAYYGGNVSYPFFARGGSYSQTTTAGLYYHTIAYSTENTGASTATNTTRFVLLVGSGL